MITRRHILELGPGTRLKDILRRGQRKLKKQKIGEGERCRVCGVNSHAALIIHHVIPVEELGDSIEGNCIILCRNCHALVHETRAAWNRTPEGITAENANRIYKHLTLAQCEMLVAIATAKLELAE